MSETIGEITPPAGMGGEQQDGYQGGDPQGGQPQLDPGAAPQGGDPGQQAPADPLAAFKMPDGRIDGQGLATAYQKQGERMTGLENLLAEKVAEMNSMMARMQNAPQPQPQQQVPVDPYEQWMAELPGDSMYTADEYRRMAQLQEIAAANAVNRVLSDWSQRMNQGQAAQAEQAYNTVTEQVRNQFATYMQTMSLEFPDMANMGNQMVAYLNNDPGFMGKLQAMARGGPGFTSDEVRQYLTSGRNEILRARQAVLQQLQPQAQQQAPPPAQFDEYGNPAQPQAAPGQIPGQIDPGYAARVASQGMDRTQQVQAGPEPQPSQLDILMKQKWDGYF